jgi:hypothetical protein
MIRKIFTPLLFGVLIVPAFLFAQQINVTPSTLTFNLTPGTSKTSYITVRNISNKKHTFQLNLADWYRDSLGNHVYLKPGDLKQSSASWVTLGVNVVDLDPDQVVDIPVTLSVPAGVKGNSMSWAMLFIQNYLSDVTTVDKNAKITTTIREIFRVGIHIYQTPPSVTAKSARAVSLTQDKKDANTYIFEIKNTGPTMLNCYANLELTNIESGQVFKLEVQDFPVFPEGKRLIKFKLPPTIPKGSYSALAILDYGENSPLEAIESTIVVKSDGI